MDGGGWWATVHGVAKSRTRLNDSTFTFHFHALEQQMASHSSVLAWRIPGTGEPSALPSMGSHRVRQDWRDLAAARCFLTSYFCIPVPYNAKDIFWGVLVLKCLVGFHRTIQPQHLQRYWLGHRLGLLRYWMVCPGNEQRSFCHFWGCIQALHFRLLCWPWWLLHFFWGIPAHSSRYDGHLS